MTKKLNKTIILNNKQNKRIIKTFLDKDGNSNEYILQEGDLDIKIDGKPIKYYKFTSIISIVFDEIKELENEVKTKAKNKFNQLANVLENIDNRLTVIEKQLNINN